MALVGFFLGGFATANASVKSFSKTVVLSGMNGSTPPEIKILGMTKKGGFFVYQYETAITVCIRTSAPPKGDGAPPSEKHYEKMVKVAVALQLKTKKSKKFLLSFNPKSIRKSCSKTEIRKVWKTYGKGGGTKRSFRRWLK